MVNLTLFRWTSSVSCKCSSPRQNIQAQLRNWYEIDKCLEFRQYVVKLQNYACFRSIHFKFISIHSFIKFISIHSYFCISISARRLKIHCFSLLSIIFCWIPVMSSRETGLSTLQSLLQSTGTIAEHCCLTNYSVHDLPPNKNPKVCQEFHANHCN